MKANKCLERSESQEREREKGREIEREKKNRRIWERAGAEKREGDREIEHKFFRGTSS